MDKLRTDFEKWFKSEYHPDKTGPYIKDALRFAWQASRASIVVELPKTDDYANNPHGHGRNQGIAECVEAIRSIGLSIKGE